MKRRRIALTLVVILGLGVLIWISKEVHKRKAERAEKGLISKVKKEQIPEVKIKDISELDKLIEEGRENVLESGLELAQDLIREDKFLEAKDVYRKLIQKFPTHPKVGEVEKKLWDLNIKILFSPIITDYSRIYEVQPQDTLNAIAKKFDTTVELIKRSNGLSSDLIRPGQRLKVIDAKVSLIIDKSQNTLTLKINDEIIKVYPCSTGKFNSTPTGEFKIVNKLIDPVWFKTGAIIPPDSPENILGSRWMGFDLPGYGIHGTTQPETIGKQITGGCIRMYNQDVEELYDIVPLGTRVIVID